MIAHLPMVAMALTVAAALAPKHPQAVKEPPPSWGSLIPGPHAVGFASWVATDSSRVVAGVARRVQITAWYPRPTTDSGATLRYEDYVALGSSESGEPDSPARQRKAVETFAGFLDANGVRPADVRAWLGSAMLANRVPLRGDSSHSVVLIAQGNAQAAYTQAVLAEYLASRGFTAVTTPSPLRTGSRLASVADVYPVASEQAADLAFAARAVIAAGAGSRDGVAIVGHSFGARAGLLLLANGFSSFLISLDGGIALAEATDWLADSEVRPAAIRGLVVHLYQRADSTVQQDLGLLRAMGGTQRELILVPGLKHWQFTSFGTIGARFPQVAPSPSEAGGASRAADVIRYTACRLEAWFGEKRDAAVCSASLGALVRRQVWPAAPPSR